VSFAETIASIGVALILLAFLLNLVGVMGRDSRLYLMLNLVGALLACFSSILITFVPFVILEAVWAAAALIGLMRWKPRVAEADTP
jgi:hypothetical protein